MNQNNEIAPFLEKTDIIDWDHPQVLAQAKQLTHATEWQTAKACYEFVRDRIKHTGDQGSGVTTLTASEVLSQKSGWCYAKSHLLAALLRANDIPCGFDYQRLSCSEYRDDLYCLHGLNQLYLQDFGWYRVDARGNKQGIEAKFNPPEACLAFELSDNEWDLGCNLSAPLPEVVEALTQFKDYDAMIENFPDLPPKLSDQGH